MKVNWNQLKVNWNPFLSDWPKKCWGEGKKKCASYRVSSNCLGGGGGGPHTNQMQTLI